MKKSIKIFGGLACLILVSTLISFIAATRETTIYVVRHAEKEISDSKNDDPELSAEGKQRAIALKEFLKSKKISGVFATDYKRTMQTVAPVAQRNGIPVKSYNSKEQEKLVQLIKSDFINQNVLVAGHSNTILELIRAFGQITPVANLKDDDYDLIFILTLDKNGNPNLRIKRFGKPHHSTEMPESITEK